MNPFTTYYTIPTYNSLSAHLSAFQPCVEDQVLAVVVPLAGDDLKVVRAGAGTQVALDRPGLVRATQTGCNVGKVT